MKRNIYVIACSIILASVLACTSAVITGKATADGRPLLWKHRDSGSTENALGFFDEKGYPFIGVYNSKDAAASEIWMGANSTGFSIMNTHSYNIFVPEDNQVELDQEGFFMRQALESCANLSDFEAMLKASSGTRGTTANFGVIDAFGGAAFYEVGIDYFHKYDANDSKTAPQGYLIRTNFSFSQEKETGEAYIRYQTVADQLFWGYLNEKISVPFVLQDVDRSLKHSLLKHDLLTQLPDDEDDQTLIPFADYVNRKISVSTMVIEGIAKGQDPSETTLWTVLGFPLTTPAIPTWVCGGRKLPEVLQKGAEQTPFMNEMSLKLKADSFPVKFITDTPYLDLAKTANKQKTGYLQKVNAFENELFEEVQALRAKDFSDKVKAKKIRKLYKKMDEKTRLFYEGLVK